MVFQTGVPGEEYEARLDTTTALVSLSKAEGYGLPLVEAMSHGTPVIASDIPIFREVGGDAVGYVHPDSPAEFAAAILNNEPMGFYSPRLVLDDVRRHGIEAPAPHVNDSQADCTL